MRRFEWNSLLPGDRVLVHDDDGSLSLEPGVVAMVDPKPTYNEIAVRVEHAGATDQLIRPRRRAVHASELDRSEPCWRCDAIARQDAGVRRTAKA